VNQGALEGYAALSDLSRFSLIRYIHVFVHDVNTLQVRKFHTLSGTCET